MAKKFVSPWVIERSVFYLYSIDWLYLQDWKDWMVIICLN